MPETGIAASSLRIAKQRGRISLGIDAETAVRFARFIRGLK